MSKDSYWFKHDSTAGRTIKMRKLQHLYTHWAKGVYWDVVELLRDQDGYKMDSSESSLQFVCDLIGCKDEVRFLNWFKSCLELGLLESVDGYFYCPALSKNMSVWETKKANGSKGGRPKKTESKPKDKPKPKPNQNHKIIEDKIIEDNKRELFKSWIKYRKEISKPIKSDATLLTLADKFNDNSYELVSKVVNSSIENQWQGLFWDRFKDLNNNKASSTDSYAANVMKKIQDDRAKEK